MNPDQQSHPTPPTPPQVPDNFPPTLDPVQPSPFTQPEVHDQVLQPVTSPSDLAPKPSYSRKLSIIGLILSCISGAIGLVVSIIALVKAKKAGVKDKIALAGVIVGIGMCVIGITLATVVGVFAFNKINEIVTECNISGKASIEINDLKVNCEDFKLVGAGNEANATTLSKTDLYSNSRFSFAYPEYFEKADQSNRVTIIGSAKPSERELFNSPRSQKGEAAAVIVYNAFNSKETSPIDKSLAENAMQEAYKAYLGSSNAQMLSYHSDSGHGCAANFKFTSQPKYNTDNNLVGITYGFTCTSLYGEVQGAYGVWYDAYGDKQTLLVSSLNRYWKMHAADLSAIVFSAHGL